MCLVFLSKIKQENSIDKKSCAAQPVSIYFIFFNRHNVHTILSSFYLITTSRIYSRRESRPMYSCVITETAVYIYTLLVACTFQTEAGLLEFNEDDRLMRNYTVFSARQFLHQFNYSFSIFFSTFQQFSHWMAFLFIVNEFRIVVLLFDMFNGKKDEKREKNIFRPRRIGAQYQKKKKIKINAMEYENYTEKYTKNPTLDSKRQI